MIEDIALPSAGTVPAGRLRFAASVRGLPAVWLSSEGPGVVPGLPVPPYQGAPFVLARDGRTPLALADGTEPGCNGSSGDGGLTAAFLAWPLGRSCDGA